MQGWAPASMKLSLFSQLALPGVARVEALLLVQHGAVAGPSSCPPCNLAARDLWNLPRVTSWDFSVIQIVGPLPGTLCCHTRRQKLGWDLTRFCLYSLHSY